MSKKGYFVKLKQIKNYCEVLERKILTVKADECEKSADIFDNFAMCIINSLHNIERLFRKK